MNNLRYHLSRTALVKLAYYMFCFEELLQNFTDLQPNNFQLNICGKVDDCPKIQDDDAAVCDSSTSIGRLRTELSFSDGGFLTLTYPGAGKCVYQNIMKEVSTQRVSVAEKFK